MNYDLVVLCHPKDYVKLEFCISSCLKFSNPKPDGIYIVSPDEIRSEGITHIHDNDAISIKKENINYRRPNWIYQQLIKLCQDFTKNDHYLCVDSDLIFNRDFHLFDGEKAKFFISDRDQKHDPYFSFMKMAYDLSRQVGFTFINDFMMFDKAICRQIVPDIEQFLGLCNDNVSDECLLSEFELYGNYVTKHHPELYTFKNTKTQTNGRFAHQPWSKEEIINLLEANVDKDIDLFTIHSWT
jgi:hypothetical protein